MWKPGVPKEAWGALTAVVIRWLVTTSAGLALALAALEGVAVCLACDAWIFEKIRFFALPPIILGFAVAFLGPGGRPLCLPPAGIEGKLAFEAAGPISWSVVEECGRRIMLGVSCGGGAGAIWDDALAAAAIILEAVLAIKFSVSPWITFSLLAALSLESAQCMYCKVTSLSSPSTSSVDGTTSCLEKALSCRFRSRGGTGVEGDCRRGGGGGRRGEFDRLRTLHCSWEWLDGTPLAVREWHLSDW